MTLTVEQILKDALGIINANEIDETPSDSDMQIAMRTANIMLDRWSSQHLMLRSTDTLVFNTVGDQASYTVGSTGADITAAKPLNIQSAYVTDSNIDYSLDVIDKSVYDGFQDKNVSLTRPQYICFDPNDAQQTSQKGTFYLYATPDKTYSVTCEVDSYLTEFVNLTDTVSFEPAYYEAIIYNLAIRLFRRYHPITAQLPQDVALIALSALNNIKTMNSTRVPSALDIPGAGRQTYNIYTDGY